MKLIAKIKLVPNSKTQLEALKDTLLKANECCNWISKIAFANNKFRKYDIHTLTYAKARTDFNLGAQAVVRCIGKVADAYILSRKTEHSFKKTGAMIYDNRMLTYHISKKEVSIWTTKGRLKIPFEAGQHQLDLLKNQKGESQLILHKGSFYLAACCDIDDPPEETVTDFLGVDLGIVSIATDSDGKKHSGKTVLSIRNRSQRLRSKLQSVGTQSAKRHLKKLSGREHNFVSNTNHCISKQIVAKAKGTHKGIAIENLKGIPKRATVSSKKQRAVLHNWAFYQLRTFLTYKAKRAGVKLVLVNPVNTSRECSQCKHIDIKNRPNQKTFICQKCNHKANADVNAAMVIRSRAVINQPIVA